MPKHMRFVLSSGAAGRFVSGIYSITVGVVSAHATLVRAMPMVLE